MSKPVKWAVYVITGLAGVFLALVVFANINGQAFEDSSSPQAIERTVGNAISQQLLRQIDSQLQTANPCLQTVTAKPAKAGISYKYYDASVDKTLVPAGLVRVVILNANDYQVSMDYSNDGSCQYRPKNSQATTQKTGLAGPFVLDPATSKIIANTFSKTDQKIQTAALAAIDVNKPIGSGTYTQTLAESNPTFDITKCCALPASTASQPNPAGDYNASL
ncbi:MAG TPA: hypothetical protein VMQ44_01410 [Candidatus Saccharimonadales bacterium]|nr:hypothetical protein [Candidatus Saccharimonadales bacterium]